MKFNQTFSILSILFIFVIFPAACIYLIMHYYNKEGTLTWNPEELDHKKLERTGDRGLIISTILFLSVVIQAIMKYCGASATPLLLFYGFFMAAVFGYMGDQGFGTDDGFGLYYIGKNTGSNGKLNKEFVGISCVLKYVLGKLFSPQFIRYIVTVFLDLFISMPIQSVISITAIPYIMIIKQSVPLFNFSIVQGLLQVIIRQFDNILQSVVYIATFLLYSNDTRFKWAYPGDDIEPSKLIQTSTIKLSTAIAGVVYLVSTIPNNKYLSKGDTYLKAGDPLADRLDRKLYFVLFIILLISFCVVFYKHIFDKSLYLKFNTNLTNYNKEKDWKEHTNRKFDNNNLYKPAEFEVQKRDHNSKYPSLNKYNYFDNWREGLGILSLYLVIGMAVPFLPLNIIYSSHELKQASWKKFLGIIFVIICIIAIIGVICHYGIEKENVLQSEEDLLNEINSAKIKKQEKHNILIESELEDELESELFDISKQIPLQQQQQQY